MSSRPFYAGLFTLALATLVLEVVDTRVLSVLTWYHLAFLAISFAMLGLTAGGLYTYLSPARFATGRVGGELARFALLFAWAIPFSHLSLIVIRIPTQLGGDPMQVWTLVAAVGVAALPFFFAGVVVALGLTRVALPLGRIYAADLAGASLGCAAAILLLDGIDPTSGVFLLGGLAALASAAFARAAGAGMARRALWSALLLAACGLANAALYPRLLSIDYMKDQPVPRPLLVDRWNSHSRVTGRPPVSGPASLWGAGSRAVAPIVRQVPLRIDGGAFTVATAFDGRRQSLAWLAGDLTSLAYEIRGTGDAAVIGVGGGRDLLTGIAFGSRRIVGIELNAIFLDLLRGELAELTGLADRPEVTLVHAEGRSYLARDPASYDLIQMALVDTWASTAAGAMTLSENGLYTVEAWRTVLSRLRPGGVFSVARWYAAGRPGETARLLSLGVSTLLAEGCAQPRDHLVLAAAGNLSNLLVGRDPFTADDLARLHATAERQGFDFLALPGAPAGEPTLDRILAARSPAELAAATAHADFDLTPPTDERPFFFNMLRPAAWLRGGAATGEAGGVIAGNLRATQTLVAILAAMILLTLATIVGPLVARGRGHGLGAGPFAAAAVYFSLLGLGFMLIEIALIQRFSVLLGHPIYSMVVTLLSLILSTGAGSFLSDAVPLSRRRLASIPLVIAAIGLATAWGLPPLLARSFGLRLPLRALLVVATTAPLGLVLGLCFPIGMRLLRHRSADAMPWMWGINGALSVVGSVVAVLLSMSAGITWCLATGSLCYLALLAPLAVLARSGAAAGDRMRP